MIQVAAARGATTEQLDSLREQLSTGAAGGQNTSAYVRSQRLKNMRSDGSNPRGPGAVMQPSGVPEIKTFKSNYEGEQQSQCSTT